jgi:hypothetical protein
VWQYVQTMRLLCKVLYSLWRRITCGPQILDDEEAVCPALPVHRYLPCTGISVHHISGPGHPPR